MNSRLPHHRSLTACLTRMLGFALVLCLLAPRPTAAQESAATQGETPADEALDSLFVKAGRLFDLGRFEEAAERYRYLLNPDGEPRLSDRERLVIARRNYGIILADRGEIVKAQEQWTQMLDLNSGVELDPAFIPPEILELYDQVRTQWFALRKPTNPPSDPFQPPEPPPLWQAALPFGAGQFVNDEPTKGTLLLSAQVLALGINVWAWNEKENLPTHTLNGQLTVEDPGRYDQLQQIQLIGFGLFAGLLTYGVVDGIYQHQTRAEAEAVPPEPAAWQLAPWAGPEGEVGMMLHIPLD